MSDAFVASYVKAATDLVREERWSEAAEAYDRAMAVERSKIIPDIAAILRWKKAAERCRENAEAPSEGW